MKLRKTVWMLTPGHRKTDIVSTQNYRYIIKSFVLSVTNYSKYENVTTKVILTLKKTCKSKQ